MRPYGFWAILKKYYLYAILSCAIIGLNEEISNPSTMLHSTVRAFFEQPTFTEYMNVHVKNMGMTRESIPEGGGNMHFKDFMIEHITGHWPCVFRELVTSWPAI